MVDNIRLPTGVGPLTSPRPVKPVKQQDKDNRDRRFEEQLKKQGSQSEEDAAAEDRNDNPTTARDSDEARDMEQHQSDKNPKAEGDAGTIIDIHA